MFTHARPTLTHRLPFLPFLSLFVSVYLPCTTPVGAQTPAPTTAAATGEAPIVRREHLIDSTTPGVRLALREVRVGDVAASGAVGTKPAAEPSMTRAGRSRDAGRAAGASAAADGRSASGGAPVLLVHGGGPGAIGFDLPVPGASVAEAIARAGHVVYLLDIRGWGGSTKPAAFDGPVDAAPPAVSSAEAAEDIGAAVRWLHARAGRRVALVGWASGGHWSGMYAATPGAARTLSHVVMLNSLYGVKAGWSLSAACGGASGSGSASGSGGSGSSGSGAGAGAGAGQPIGAYRLATREALLGRWDASIPVEDKAAWRDPRVAAAYVDSTLATDPTSRSRTPPSARIPYGYLQDACAMSQGRVFWQASQIRVPTLVVRGALDFWSRPEDLAALDAGLTRAPRKRIVTIPDATHHLLFDRPEHGRDAFLRELFAFLGA